MDYTDITKADIQNKLDDLGVKYTTRDTKEDLIAKLEAGNIENPAEQQVEPSEVAEVKPEEVKKEEPAVKLDNEFELARNVKYRGVYYKSGESIKLDESDIEYFKNKQLII